MINLTKEQKDNFLIHYFTSFGKKTGNFVVKDKGHVTINVPVEIGSETNILETMKIKLLEAYNTYIIDLLNVDLKDTNRDLIFESSTSTGKITLSW